MKKSGRNVVLLEYVKRNISFSKCSPNWKNIMEQFWKGERAPKFPIFSRRFSREKCPILAVASFFFSSDHRPHRVCTTFYRLHCRSHVLVSTRFTVHPAVTGSSPCFSQKLFRAIFFGTVRLFQFFSVLCDFFSNFFVSKGSSLNFFDILQQTGFSKSPKGPPFNKFLKNALL